MSTKDDAYSEAHLDQPAWLKLMGFLEICGLVECASVTSYIVASTHKQQSDRDPWNDVK